MLQSPPCSATRLQPTAFPFGLRVRAWRAILGVSGHAPAYSDQLCVLLPERAHIGRINSILRRENSTKYQATGNELRRAYADAYGKIGNYCGGGEAKIKEEPLAIVKADFQILGVQ